VKPATETVAGRQLDPSTSASRAVKAWAVGPVLALRARTVCAGFIPDRRRIELSPATVSSLAHSTKASASWKIQDGRLLNGYLRLGKVIATGA